jgi:hypothetical protein
MGLSVLAILSALFANQKPKVQNEKAPAEFDRGE